MFLNISDKFKNLTVYPKTLLEFVDSFLPFFVLEATKYLQFVIYISLFYFAIDRNIHSYEQIGQAIGHGLKQRGSINVQISFLWFWYGYKFEGMLEYMYLV